MKSIDKKYKLATDYALRKENSLLLDFDSITDNKQFDFYKKNGGIIDDKQLYMTYVKFIMLSIIDHIMTRSSIIEIPFFGEIYLEEKQVKHTRSKSVRRNNFFIPEVVFRTYHQRNKYINVYSVLERIKEICGRVEFNKRGTPEHKTYKHKRLNTESQIMFNISRAKRKNKSLYFSKRYLKSK